MPATCVRTDARFNRAAAFRGHGEHAHARTHPHRYVVGEGDSRTFVYSIGKATWARTATRPYTSHHSGICAVGGRVYLVGGLGQAAAKVQVFDPVLEAWSVGPDAPVAAQGSMSVAAIGTTIYACGGLDVRGRRGKRNPVSCAKLVTERNAWFATAPMLLGVDHAAAGTDGRRLYVFGGRNTGVNYPAPGTRRASRTRACMVLATPFKLDAGGWRWVGFARAPTARVRVVFLRVRGRGVHGARWEACGQTPSGLAGGAVWRGAVRS